jgi:hypothetical protein
MHLLMFVKFKDPPKRFGRNRAIAHLDTKVTAQKGAKAGKMFGGPIKLGAQPGFHRAEAGQPMPVSPYRR